MPTSRNAVALGIDHDGSVAGQLDLLDMLNLLNLLDLLELLEGKRVLRSFKRGRK